MQIRQKLKQISLFASLTDDKQLLDKLSEIMIEEHFSEGSYVIKEDEVGDKMYILSKGRVIIEKRTKFGDTFPVVKLDDKMNVFFGELALLDNDHRSASVIAETDTVCYAIKRKDFDRFCETHPKVGYLIVREIAKSLAQKLRKTTFDNMFLIDALCNQSDLYDQ